MAYNNPFYYNRSSSVSDNYTYIDATTFSPIYGSSVDFSSRINIIPTSDNTLKILPASENNLTVRYKLRFALNDVDAGNLLKTIETAAGVKYLKFKDPSEIYKSMVGYVEDYNVNKSTNGNINEITITLSSYTSSPLFNWKTSSLININIVAWSFLTGSTQNFKKFDVVYVASSLVNLNSVAYNLPYNFITSLTNINNYDNEIYHVDDSSIEVGGFKYFLPFKISTRVSSEDIIDLNTKDSSTNASIWKSSTTSKIYYLKNKNELILSQTDTSTANKKLYINSYDLINKKFTNLTSFQTQDAYYSFRNANDLYLVKGSEMITYLSNGPIATSSINSSLYIYKYNFETKLIEIFCKIDPLLKGSPNSFYVSTGAEITAVQYSTINNYSMKIISPTSCSYANGKLYFLAEINFNYKVSTTITNAPFRINCILAVDIVTKTYTASYITKNMYTGATTTLNATTGLSCFTVDPITDIIYAATNNVSNTIRKIGGIYSLVTGFSATYYIPKSIYAKNNNIFVIGESGTLNRFTTQINNSLSTPVELNEIDNFLIAKEDGVLYSSLTRNFFFDPKLAFDFKNKFDFKQLDYRNSFIQNVKYKENENTLKQFNLKFENITTAQCKAMLFFLEKKCGYRRFLYDFPIFLKTKKVFICTEWSHTFKYDDCHDLNLLLIEDPNPNIRIPATGEYSADYLLIRS